MPFQLTFRKSISLRTSACLVRIIVCDVCTIYAFTCWCPTSKCVLVSNRVSHMGSCALSSVSHMAFLLIFSISSGHPLMFCPDHEALPLLVVFVADPFLGRFGDLPGLGHWMISRTRWWSCLVTKIFVKRFFTIDLILFSGNIGLFRSHISSSVCFSKIYFSNDLPI